MAPVFGLTISLTDEETEWVTGIMEDLDELHDRREIARAALRAGLSRARKLDAGMLALEEALVKKEPVEELSGPGYIQVRGSNTSVIAPLDQLEAAVDAEWQDHRGCWPNPPDAACFARHAEALGLNVQPICDGDHSTGTYYTVIAIYAPGVIFARKPLGLIFEDFSKSIDVTWVARF